MHGKRLNLNPPWETAKRVAELKRQGHQHPLMIGLLCNTGYLFKMKHFPYRKVSYVHAWCESIHAESKQIMQVAPAGETAIRNPPLARTHKNMQQPLGRSASSNPPSERRHVNQTAVRKEERERSKIRYSKYSRNRL